MATGILTEKERDLLLSTHIDLDVQLNRLYQNEAAKHGEQHFLCIEQNPYGVMAEYDDSSVTEEIQRFIKNPYQQPGKMQTINEFIQQNRRNISCIAA